jgi:low affinity Fe/Cu permease
MRLNIKPTTAVISIISASMWEGCTNLMTASLVSQMVIATRKITETIVPIISARYHPNVSEELISIIPIFRDIMEMKKPTMSEAK